MPGCPECHGLGGMGKWGKMENWRDRRVLSRKARDDDATGVGSCGGLFNEGIGQWLPVGEW